MAFLQMILDFISNNLMSAATMIAVVVEFALRLFPSQKPLSIAYLIANGAKMLGNIFTAIGSFLDKILPQKLV